MHLIYPSLGLFGQLSLLLVEEEYAWRPKDLQSKLMRLRSKRAQKVASTTGLKEGVRVNRGDGLQVLASQGQAAAAANGMLVSLCLFLFFCLSVSKSFFL